MEGELWTVVYQTVQDASRNYRSVGVVHRNTTIVLTYLWAVLKDRPVSWACRRENWPKASRRRRLPSPSCMSRRLRSRAVRELLNDVERRLVRRFGPTWYRCIDARPLAVGWSSKDPQARVGRAAGGKAKGYKLYAVTGANGVFEAWELMPMNVNEARVAKHLVRHVEGAGYLVGDGQYDSNPLHRIVASTGHVLVAPLPHGTDFGHRPQTPGRRRVRDLLTRPFGQALLHHRASIDRRFGNMSSFGGGLVPLPPWVRTYRRVRLWVQGKIIFNTARLWLKHKAKAA